MFDISWKKMLTYGGITILLPEPFSSNVKQHFINLMLFTYNTFPNIMAIIKCYLLPWTRKKYMLWLLFWLTFVTSERTKKRLFISTEYPETICEQFYHYLILDIFLYFHLWLSYIPSTVAYINFIKKSNSFRNIQKLLN